MTTENEINEIGEEINLYETETNLINNVVPKPEELGEPSRRNTHFLRPMYVPVGHLTNFSFGFIPTKIRLLKILTLPQLTKLDIS